MQAAVDVGVLGLHGVHHGVDDGAGFLGAGGGVQEDQFLAVHGLREDREIGADFFHVEGGDS